MLSSRARYATRALLHLSLRHEEGPVLIQDIADAQQIPLKYLQQILVSLKNAGFVQSRKGPGGGYALAMAPRDIKLGAVLHAMDGPLAPVGCVSNSPFSDCGCPNPETCVLRETFTSVRDAMADVLDQTNFADLAAQQAEAWAKAYAMPDFVI